MKNEPKNISPLSENISEELNYDFLREEGISLVQKYSGSKWTDYNYHDPGVTILEQLCYALTDLGYRANFRIEDLLQINAEINQTKSHRKISRDKASALKGMETSDPL